MWTSSRICHEVNQGVLPILELESHPKKSCPLNLIMPRTTENKLAERFIQNQSEQLVEGSGMAHF